MAPASSRAMNATGMRSAFIFSRISPAASSGGLQEV
jgi:hypothetical protein